MPFSVAEAIQLLHNRADAPQAVVEVMTKSVELLRSTWPPSPDVSAPVTFVEYVLLASGMPFVKLSDSVIGQLVELKPDAQTTFDPSCSHYLGSEVDEKATFDWEFAWHSMQNDFVWRETESSLGEKRPELKGMVSVNEAVDFVLEWAYL